MTRNLARMLRALLFLAALAGLSPAALRAQDSLTLGRVKSPAGVVRVPVYLKLTRGTAFDARQGRGLQGVSFRVVYRPAARISNARIDRTGSGGLISSMAPILEMTPGTGDSISYVGLFEEAIPAVLDAPSPGQKIMDLVLTVEPGAPGVIVLEFDCEATTLSNQGGTVLENASGAGLSLVAGAIEIDLPGRRRPS